MQEKGGTDAWKAVAMHNFVSCLWLHSNRGYCWWLLATSLNDSCTSSTHITKLVYFANVCYYFNLGFIIPNAGTSIQRKNSVACRI
jgi:hypothetical protein